MTNQERLVRAERILRQQNTGKITKAQASAEFDALLDESTGDLHYYSDTTCMKADWDPQVMLMPHRDNPCMPSNTGIVTQGPKRGEVVTKPGETPNHQKDTLQHFIGTGRIQ